MLPDSQRAWRDWRRVEECLVCGVERWGFTLAGLWLSNHWLEPLSVWLSAAADVVILTVHFQVVKRIDARMEASASRL